MKGREKPRKKVGGILELIIKEDVNVTFDSDFDFEKLRKVLFSTVGVVLIVIAVSGLGENCISINVYKKYIHWLE